jgi:purine-nucleoside phosphorylase
VLLAAPETLVRPIAEQLPRTRNGEPQVAAAVAAIRRRWSGRPQYALVLGTGLGGLADRIDADAVIPYCEIPGFPRSTALAHKGQLVCGSLAGQTVVALQGRCHLYEGYCFEQLTLATRVMAALGAQRLIVSNAAGGINPRFARGDVMLIDDHLNLTFQRLPLWASDLPARDCGDRLGVPSAPRHYYCRGMMDEMLELARRENIALQRGVYVAVTGPNYETRAEYRMFRRLGGDAVGMSTIPEVLTAADCGMQVLGFSAITNIAQPDAPQQVDPQEVVDVATFAAPKIERLLTALLRNAGAETVGAYPLPARRGL